MQDGGGELDTKELKVALRGLQDAGKQVGNKAKDLEKLLAKHRAAARDAQQELQRQVDEDDQAAREVQERIDQEKREKAAAAEAARAAKAAAAARKAEEDARKRAEFEARVAAKR